MTAAFEGDENVEAPLCDQPEASAAPFTELGPGQPHTGCHRLLCVARSSYEDGLAVSGVSATPPRVPVRVS